MKCVIIFVSLAALSAVAAETNSWPKTITVTNNGIVYKDAEVVKVELDAITVVSGTTGGRVPLKNLPPDLQKEFGYQPATAAAAASIREGDRLDRARQLALTEQNRQLSITRQKAVNKQSNDLAQARMLIDGAPFQIVPEGILIFSGQQHRSERRAEMRAEQSRYPNPPGVYGRSFGTTTFKRINVGGEFLYGSLCLLTDYPSSGLSEQDRLKVIAYPNGFYDYTTTRGFPRKVRRFTHDPSKMTGLPSAAEIEVMRNEMENP